MLRFDRKAQCVDCSMMLKSHLSETQARPHGGGVPLVYVEVEGHDLKLVYLSKVENRRGSLAEFEKSAEGQGMRVHKSFWINLDFLVERRRKGRQMFAILETQTEIPVGRQFEHYVKEALQLKSTTLQQDYSGKKGQWAETEVEAKVAHWSYALEHDDLGSYCLTADCSKSWYQMRGYPNFTHALHNPGAWFNRLHPDDREAALKLICQHNSGKVTKTEIRYRERHADGRWIWILSQAEATHHDSAGRATRVSGVDMDVSDEANSRGR